MTDASSDSDDSAGRTQEWEIVSLPTLSTTGSGGGACSCEVCASSTQGTCESGGGAPHPNLLSNHFGSAGDQVASPMLDQYLGSQIESRTGAEDQGNNDAPMHEMDGNLNNSNSTETPAVGMDVEEPRQVEASSGKREEKTDATEAKVLPAMDWIEPMPPSTNHLMNEESDVGSNSSMIYDMTCEKKPSSEFDGGEAAGPLLGSCTSPPSDAAIVSSVGAFRAGSWGEDVLQSSLGAEECSMASNCAVEEELAGLEREILGTDSGFDSFREAPVVNTKQLEFDNDEEDSVLADNLRGEGREDQSSCEAWWKRRAALWFVEARQASTLWSLALAAAVMGLVILGQRWQHERYQNHHLRLQLCTKDEKISQLLFQVARLKDALSGRRRVPVLRTSFRERF